MDDDLLKGLEDMDKKEKEQLKEIKKQFTPRENKSPTKTSAPPVKNQVGQGEQMVESPKQTKSAPPPP